MSEAAEVESTEAGEHRNFAARFESERAGMRGGATTAVFAGALLFALLLGILLWLESGAAVYVYVALLFAIACYGLLQIRDATQALESAAEDLSALALDAAEAASREGFLEKVARRQRAAERSDVPDALLGLASDRVTAERTQGVARAAFRSALARMNETAFLRTALVLGGLFGTVLFFANELVGTQILRGDLSVLLPGLRGALASTLTGILGSLVLGLLASRLERIIDGMLSETEAFLLGPVSTVLQATTARRAVTTETDLWQQLVEEVAQLRQEAADSLAGMGTDAHVFAKQLENVVDQIRMLPAVTVPPNLADLGAVVTEFRTGMKDLKETVDVLVPAVQTIGATLPLETAANVQMLLELEDAGRRAMEHHIGEVRTAISRMENAVAENQTSIEALREAERAAPTEVLALAGAARDEAHAARQGVAQLASALTEHGRRLDAVQEALRTTEGTQQALALTQADLVRAGEAVQASAGELRAESDSLRETASQIDEATTRFTAAGSALQGRLHVMDEVIRKVHDQDGAFARIEESVGQTVGELQRRLSPLLDWHRRAASAPMMRFLTLPLWAGNRQVSGRTPEGQDRAPS